MYIKLIKTLSLGFMLFFTLSGCEEDTGRTDSSTKTSVSTQKIENVAEKNSTSDIQLGEQNNGVKLNIDDKNLSLKLGEDDDGVNLKVDENGLKLNLGDKDGVSINLGGLFK